MPQVRKLEPAEVQAIEVKQKGQRRVVEEQYDTLLSDFAMGDYGEVFLEPDEKRITVRNRLRSAADRRDMGIEFRRTRGDVLRFKLVGQMDGEGMDEAEDEAEAVAEPVASSDVAPELAPARKGGRKKKTA